MISIFEFKYVFKLTPTGDNSIIVIFYCNYNDYNVCYVNISYYKILLFILRLKKYL
jgi:hypothetical protein